MEKSAGEFLYRELSFRALLTANSEQRLFKMIWLCMLLGAVGLTFIEDQLQQPLLFISDNLNFRFLINPLISLMILSIFWFGFQWTTIIILANTLLRIGLHGVQWPILFTTLSDLVFFGMVAQIYRTLPLSPNLRHVHAWFTFLLVVFLSASMGETVNLWLADVSVENHYHHWVQGWMTNWLNSVLILPFLLLFTPLICRLRDRGPVEQLDYARSGAIFSLFLLISSVLLFLFLSYSFGLDLVSPQVIADQTPLHDFANIVLLTLGMMGFILISLTYLGYYLFQQWSLSLGQKAEEAIQANEAKSRFISQMTHELRTPLNAVIGLTRLVLGSSLTYSQREHINNIRSSAALLNSLINELLDYSKIEANKLELEYTAFSLEDVLNRVSAVLGPRCSEKKIAFLVDMSPQIPRFVVGDPLRIEQVLLNLLSNAIKFTDKGHVLLSIQLQESDNPGEELVLDFSIEDTGIGIAAEQLPFLFQPFRQADKSIARRFGGTGLGLMICRSLIQLMGSDIAIRSTVDEGSVFSFTLHLGHRTESENDAAEPFRCEKLWLILHHQSEAGLIAEAQLKSWGGAVDVISHEKDIQSWLTRQARKQPVPDLLFLMHKLGSLDGITVLRTLRNLPSWRKVPVLLTFPASEEETFRQALGDDPHVVLMQLPFYGSILPNAIANALGENTKTSVTRLPQTDWQNMLTGVQVLLVEDNPINRQIAIETLQQVGIDVAVAIDGKEGIERATKGNFDVVLMDVDLPEVDGITATYWLRNQGFSAPILAMTAYDDAKERERCLKAGMNDFMIKPFEPDTLYSMLYQWTRGKGQEQTPRLNYLPLTDKPGPATEPIALDVITGFARVGNNPQLYQQILTTFQTEYQDHGTLMQLLAEEENWSVLERIAHNLKSTSRYIGADSLSNESGRLEKMLRESDGMQEKRDQARKLVVNIHILLMAVFEAIQSIPALTQMVNANVDVSATDKPKLVKSDEQLPRVLIADDELIHRKMLIALLEPECEVIAVEDGAEAVKIALSQPIDLILLDMVMPNMRGEEVIRQLRSRAVSRDIDIVIISARNDVEDEETGFLMGATDYITKPFHPTIVQARIRNVLRLIKQRRMLDQLAHLDGLTGIPNRRKFEQVVENEWSRYKTAEKPLSLAIIDVDHFKKFNDTFGHARGDDVLQAVASTIRDLLRRTGDFVARLGGEEFVLIFSEADAQASKGIAEQIRRAVEEIELSVGRVTVSIGGVTFVPRENLNWSQVMDQADALLYEAKQGGRNQVRWMAIAQ